MIAHQQELDSLVGALLPFAQLMLTEHGAFLPFGGVIGQDRGVALVAGELAREDITVPELVEAMTVLLRTHVGESSSIAAGYCVDVSIVDPRNQAKTDAVQLVFEHRSGEAVNVFFPYLKNDAGAYTFEHPFAQNAGQRIFEGVPNTHLN